MKVTHSMCGPYKDSGIFFGPAGSKAFRLDLAGLAHMERRNYEWGKIKTMQTCSESTVLL